LATISKVRKLVNPGKRRRKMTRKQIMFFGTKRQRAAIRANRGKRASRASLGSRRFRKATGAKRKYYAQSHITRLAKRYKFNRGSRKKNVGSIVTVWPLGHANPGRKRSKIKYTKKGHPTSKWTWKRRNRGKKIVVINRGGYRMARVRRKRVNRSYRRRNRSRRRNYGTRVGRSWSGYSLSGGFKRKRRNPGRRRRHAVRHYRGRRRNPGMLAGTAGRVVGVLGGVAVTKLLFSFVPSTFATGVMSYLSIGVIAVAQGKLIGKVSKNSQLGDDFMVGGLAYLVAKVLNDFFPTVGTYTGISGMRGIGLIGGSSFYTPQVNQNGSMGSFILPGSVQGAIAAGMPVAPANAGVGRLRKTGRLM